MSTILKKSAGFTFIELIIAAIIISILAAIAIPSYKNFSRRSYYNQIVEATAPIKVAVTDCYKVLKTLKGCDGGSHHVPANVTVGAGMVETIVTVSGVITAVPKALHGIVPADDYILTPTPKNGELDWIVSGGALTKAYVN